MDFRQDDKVWSYRYGNGVIRNLGDERVSYPINVYFESGESDEYTIGGKLYSEDNRRDLYHGHDVDIQIVEYLPKREVSEWIIRYEGGSMGGRVFKSEEEARDYNKVDDKATYHEIKVLR